MSKGGNAKWNRFSFTLHTQRNVGLQKSIRRESGFPLLSGSSSSGRLSVYHPGDSLVAWLSSSLELLFRASG